MLCFPAMKMILDILPVLLLLVLGHSLTDPGIEKAIVLCEACLHAHEEPSVLDAPTETPLSLLILDSFQKELPHIVI